MKTTKTINVNWTEYDKSTALCHLENYGVIYLDRYGYPVDDFDEIEEMIKEGKE